MNTKPTFLALGLFGLSASSLAAPFVVSDPIDPTATHCGFKIDASTRIDVPIALSGTDKICKMDLAGLAVGSHTVNATAVRIDTVWGRQESAPSVNFTFAVPTIPTSPLGLKLVP